MTGALYLADAPKTSHAEWFRAIAEQGLRPEEFLPFDLHTWSVDLELIDLSTEELLDAAGLSMPRPSRRDWPSFQGIGEQIAANGHPGLVAPSAALPRSSVICVFTEKWPPAGCAPIEATTVDAVPPKPPGMRA